MGGEVKKEKRARERVHSLRKTTHRHQMAGYGLQFFCVLQIFRLARPTSGGAIARKAPRGAATGLGL